MMQVSLRIYITTFHVLPKYLVFIEPKKEEGLGLKIMQELQYENQI